MSNQRGAALWQIAFVQKVLQLSSGRVNALAVARKKPATFIEKGNGIFLDSKLKSKTKM